MIIDFDEMEEKANPEFKGGKGVTYMKKYEDELGKIILGRLEPGSSVGLHTHETNSEIIYIVSGKADFIYDDKTESATAGGCHYCPEGHTHTMINNNSEDLIFFATVR